MPHAMTGFLIDVARLTLWLGLLALLFAPIERLFALRRREGRRALLADLGYFYLNGLLPIVLLAPPLALVALAVRAATPDAYATAVAGLPLAIALGMGLIVSEIGAYWAHRWCHASPFLWRFHAVHHATEHLDWLANTRAHPIDVVFVRLCGLVPLYVLGLASPDAHGTSAMVPVYVTLAGTVWAFLIHANVRWRFGPIEQIVATPAFHHWHHTNGAAHRDRNFAALMPWIDRLFGTLHLPRDWPPCYGVDAPVPGGIAGELLHPFAPPRRAPPPAAADAA